MLEEAKLSEGLVNGASALSVDKKGEMQLPVFKSEKIRFVCMSDTHGKWYSKDVSRVPDGDVLLHAGDFTLRGSPEEVHSFNKLLGEFPHQVKIVIAGNHEMCLDDKHWIQKKKSEDVHKRKIAYLQKRFGVDTPRELLSNCIYLQDEPLEISGIKIYGAPWSPKYASGAFQRPHGRGMRQKWDVIPDGTDILMTHCPPQGMLDVIKRGDNVGCEDLLDVVQNKIKPRFHVFGHIHEGYGQCTDGITTYINASTCTRGYNPTNKPVVFDLDNPKFNPGILKMESSV